MAVIREKRQFRVGSIGVARSSRGGALIGEAIADSANQMSQRFFSLAAEEAREAGIKSVADLSDAQVLTLGEDGQPEAMKAPKGFGRIASKAREQALLTRFEEELEIELADKAKELSNKYRKSPEAFKKAMTDYTAAMGNAEESTIFTRAIENTGAQLTSNVYHRLQLASMQRHESEMKAHNKFANAQAYLTYESLVAAGEIDGANDVLASINERNQNDLSAGYIEGSDLLLNEVKGKTAYVKGTLTNVLSKYGKNLSAKNLAEIKLAINNSDSSLLPKVMVDNKDVFERLRSSLESTYADNNHGILVSNALKEFASPIIASAQNRNAFDNAVVAQQNLISARDQDLSEIQENALIDSSNLAGEIENIIANTKASIAKRDTAAAGFESEDYINSLTAGSAIVANEFATTLGNRIVTQAKDLDDLAALETYLRQPTQANLENLSAKNSSMGTLAEQFQKLNAGLPQFNFDNTLSDLATSFKDETRLSDFQAKASNYYSIGNSIKESPVDSYVIENNKGFAEVSSAYFNDAKKIGAENLSTEQRNQLLARLDFKTGRAILDVAFEDVPTEAKLAALDYYIKNNREISEGSLSREDIRNIDHAREKMGDEGIAVESNKKYESISNKLEAEEEAEEQEEFMRQNQFGIAENNKDNREITSAYFDDVAKSAGYESFADYLLNPRADEGINQKLAQQLAQQLRVMNVPPESAITVFNQIGLSGGINVPNGSLLRALTIYESMSERLNLRTGQEFPSAELADTLDPSAKAMLDRLLDARMSLPFDLDDDAKEAALLTKASAIRTVLTRPEFSADLREKLGKVDVNTYLIQNVPDVGIDEGIQGIVGAAIEHHYAEHIADPKIPFRPKAIADLVIQTRIREDSAIRDFGPSSPKTAFGLDITTGGERDLFIGYVRGQLRDKVSDGKDVDWDNEEFYFIPIGQDTVNKGQVYAVVNKDNVTYKMNIPDGEGGTIETGVFVSTRELDFLELSRKEEVSQALEQKTKAQSADLKDQILAEYPPNSKPRRKAINKYGQQISVTIRKIKQQLGEDWIADNFDSDEVNYFNNGVFSIEGNMVSNLTSFEERLVDVINSDPSRYKNDPNIKRLESLIKKARGFFDGTIRPLD